PGAPRKAGAGVGGGARRADRAAVPARLQPRAQPDRALEPGRQEQRTRPPPPPLPERTDRRHPFLPALHPAPPPTRRPLLRRRTRPLRQRRMTAIYQPGVVIRFCLQIVALPPAGAECWHPRVSKWRFRAEQVLRS